MLRASDIRPLRGAAPDVDDARKLEARCQAVGRARSPQEHRRSANTKSVVRAVTGAAQVTGTPRIETWARVQRRQRRAERPLGQRVRAADVQRPHEYFQRRFHGRWVDWGRTPRGAATRCPMCRRWFVCLVAYGWKPYQHPRWGMLCGGRRVTVQDRCRVCAT